MVSCRSTNGAAGKSSCRPSRRCCPWRPDARVRLHGHNVTPAEFDLLARAKSGVLVASAVNDSPHPDAEVAEAICTLMTRGVVTSAASGGASSAAS
jgi:hypothetical protein